MGFKPHKQGLRVHTGSHGSYSGCFSTVYMNSFECASVKPLKMVINVHDECMHPSTTDMQSVCGGINYF